MTDYNDGKWHGWNGGECPVHPGTFVEIRMKNGTKDEDFADMYDWNECDIGTILAFRVVKEHKEPREFWIHEGEENDCIMDIPVDGFIHVREVIE